jgi:predicted GTPase
VLEFHQLGFDKVMPVSAAHGLGLETCWTWFPNSGAGLWRGTRTHRDDEEDEADEAALASTYDARDLRLDARASRAPRAAAACFAIRGRKGPGTAIRVAIVGKPTLESLTHQRSAQGPAHDGCPRSGHDHRRCRHPVLVGGARLRLVDTAGLRRPKVIGEKLEERRSAALYQL